MGKGGNSTTSSSTTNNAYTSNISDFLGSNKSILNLGAGSSTTYTNSQTNNNENKFDNISDLTGGTAGAGGGFSAQLDMAASAALGPNSKSGDVAKTGGGFTDSPLTSLGSGGGGASLLSTPLLLIGGGLLLVILLLRRR